MPVMPAPGPALTGRLLARACGHWPGMARPLPAAIGGRPCSLSLRPCSQWQLGNSPLRPPRAHASGTLSSASSGPGCHCLAVPGAPELLCARGTARRATASPAWAAPGPARVPGRNAAHACGPGPPRVDAPAVPSLPRRRRGPAGPLPVYLKLHHLQVSLLVPQAPTPVASASRWAWPQAEMAGATVKCQCPGRWQSKWHWQAPPGLPVTVGTGRP
jgi:hypothetical protein